MCELPPDQGVPEIELTQHVQIVTTLITASFRPCCVHCIAMPRCSSELTLDTSTQYTAESCPIDVISTSILYVSHSRRTSFGQQTLAIPRHRTSDDTSLMRLAYVTTVSPTSTLLRYTLQNGNIVSQHYCTRFESTPAVARERRQAPPGRAAAKSTRTLAPASAGKEGHLPNG